MRRRDFLTSYTCVYAVVEGGQLFAACKLLSVVL